MISWNVICIAEIWSELKSGVHKQYETGKRLLSYVKPNEKFLQVTTYF